MSLLITAFAPAALIARACLALAAAPLLAPAAHAQGAPYPVKAVRLLVGLPPGGATDLQARWLSHRLSTATGRQFVMDNCPAAGGCWE